MHPSGLLKVILQVPGGGLRDFSGPPFQQSFSLVPEKNRASLYKCFLQLFLLSVSLASLIFSSPPSWTRIRVLQSAFMSHILSDKGCVT